VTSITDPDWVPIMKRAAAIITDHGGRTSHAAIVSRELGLPAIVGTGDATHVLHDEQEVTVSCAEGDEGDFVYEGIAEFEVEDVDLDHVPETPRRTIMLNLANPSAAFRWWRCRRWAWAWRGWNSWSTPRGSRCTRWRWCISTGRGRGPRKRSSADSGL
jgi:pyruvate,water dikinase